MKNKFNKIILLASLVFLLFFFKAVQNMFIKVDLDSLKGKEYQHYFETKEVSFSLLEDPSLVERAKSRNVFLSKQEDLDVRKAQAEQAEREAQAKASENQQVTLSLGYNEIKDDETGAIFKFLGIVKKKELYFAFFWKMNNLDLDPEEKKSVIIQKESQLSKNIRIQDIGATWVKLDVNRESLELRIFPLIFETK